MNIIKDGLKAKISEEELYRLLKVYSPSDEIEICYYIGAYYFSIDFDYWIDGVNRVASLVCELKDAEQVVEVVSFARNLGYKLVNLS